MFARISKNSLKLTLFLALLLIFYNEFFVYWLCYLNWPSPHKLSSFQYKNKTKIENLDERPIRLLLVADPQLIGENDEPWFLSWLARWDCDRYLRSSFVLANSFVKPDATIYLGDLFDEGLKSTDEQFKRYYDRLKSIYKFDRMQELYGTKQIFIPGDNDIGGEYMGDRNDHLAERFEQYFGSNVDLINFNSYIRFLKLDLDYTVSFYNSVKRKYVLDLLAKNKVEKNDQVKDKFTIVLNHVSILRKRQEESHLLNKDSNAGLIIKGDSHEFEIIKYNYMTRKVEEHINFFKNPSNYYIMNLKPDKSSNGVESVYELSIPTCSYRMGVPHMGFGMLTITPYGKAYVSILWLPSRFNCVKFYLLFIFLISAYIGLKSCFKRIYKKFCYIFTEKIA